MSSTEWNSFSSQQKSAHLDQYLTFPIKLSLPVQSVTHQYRGGRKAGERLPRCLGENRLEEITVQAATATAQAIVNGDRYFENNEPFSVRAVVRTDKRCAGCHGEYLRVAATARDLLLVTHKERYLYPDKNGSWTCLSVNKMREVTYHLNRNCLIKRGFRAEYLIDSTLICPKALRISNEQRQMINELFISVV